MLKIHHLPRARGLRVVWLCEEMGLPYEIAPVPFPPDEAYKKLNPVGSIPFLEDDGGVAINESIAMLLYISQKYGPTPFMPQPSDPNFARVLQMTLLGEATLGSYGNVMIGAMFMAPDDQKQNWSVMGSRDRLLQGFNYVAQVLGDRQFLVGDGFTIADISVGWMVGVARTMMGLEAQLPKSLLAYHDRLIARPAYQRAEAK